jgi:F420-dependent oxidoreductase-like protein
MTTYQLPFTLDQSTLLWNTPMRLGLNVGYSGATIDLPLEMIHTADRLGYYAAWTAEAYGSDAVAPLAWIGAQTQRIHLGTAVMQMPARTPAMTAMTAMTLDQLSGGRMLLGLGLSGPQVVEGWHGQPYGKPLGKTREYVHIVRTILARSEPLAFAGDYYQVPYTGTDATGLGKPLKSILHGRADLPIYLAAIGPKNVELAAEIADGWLPIFFAPAHYDAVFRPAVEAGFARAAASKGYAHFDIAPSVFVVMGDDVDACRAAIKPFLALYVGGMGAKGRNFYHDLVTRYGFGEEADQIQTLYLSGQKQEAAAAIPDALVDAVALCGPRNRIAEGLERWQASPINTLIINTFDPQIVSTLAELVLGNDAGHPDVAYSLPSAARPAPAAAQPAKEPSHMSMDASEAAPNAPASAAVFAQMQERIARNPNLAQRMNAIFQFNITGEPGGAWVVDLKENPGVRAGTVDGPGGADVTITMQDDDFVAMTSGDLNPMSAFAQGKIKVQGNVMLASKLQQLFS